MPAGATPAATRAAGASEPRRSAGERFELLCALALVLLGGAIQAISPNLRFQNSDSIVPVFASLYGWTPFFWDLDRFGMLIPLVAWPLRDPFQNLLVEQLLRSAATLAAPLALARLLAPRAWWFPAGLVALATWLSFHSTPAFAIASFQPYPTAVCLGSAGLLLLEQAGSGRRLAGALALLLAVWVAPTTVVWVVPLAAARSLRAAPGISVRALLRSRRVLLLVCAVAVALVQALAWSWPGIGQRTRLSLVAPGEVGVGFATFVARWGSVTSPVLVGAVLLSAAVAAGLYFRRPDELRRRLLLLAVAPLAAALVEAAVLGSIRWFHLWGLAARYVSVGILLVCLQPALWLSGLVESATQGAVWSRRRPRLAPLLCTLAALAGLVARFGLPSPAGARRVLDTQMNRSIADAALAANAAGCSHLLGDWWEVFPVALSANILRTERGGTAPPIWPLSLSSRMMRAKWEVPDWSRARVCVLANDGKWRAMAEHVGLAIADDEGERGARPIFLAAGVGERGSGATGPRL